MAEIIMASERQIAANRKNARKSTGPKTMTGKRRARRNAYRYGLSINTNLAPNSDAVESLASQIAASSNDQDVLYHARIAARAHLDLARIRHVKLDIIERMHQFGSLEPVPLFRSVAAEVRYLMNQPLDEPVHWPDQCLSKVRSARRRRFGGCSQNCESFIGTKRVPSGSVTPRSRKYRFG
jgi:hypothetical protein